MTVSASQGLFGGVNEVLSGLAETIRSLDMKFWGAQALHNGSVTFTSHFSSYLDLEEKGWAFYSLRLSLWPPNSSDPLPVISVLPRSKPVLWMSIPVSASSQSPRQIN